ncbi:hypothetical protein K9N68_39150 (plasmid) [Kovacikia minuta CCNUW1]|uniref:hypothetical protein n=1 Tax=Kovacikia minuta TaxID=2931930 RepID=UPI001CCC68FC|nr:hypothetical protein [Kovacikia minuta]UBF30162.1 hypothetical protein K9N68_39150 [Kovacikia minuta CCNUW1]
MNQPLKRCAIRNDLVEDAKRIQERYALRSWGDAINMIFAAHRKLYLEDSESTSRNSLVLPRVESKQNRQESSIHSGIESPPLLVTGELIEPIDDGNDLRSFLGEADYRLD